MTLEWPDLTVLELLVGIDDLGSLGASARRVGMAQPNATRRVRRLETQLGLPLLDRNPRGSRLTPQGTVVAHWARELLADAERLLDAASALRGERESELKIGASMTVAEHLVPSWLGAFREQHAEVHVHLRVQNSTEVAEAVLAGEHDVGFIESPHVARGLHSAVVGQDRLTVIVHKGHPWARLRRPLTVTELAAAPLVVRETGSGTRTTLDIALADYQRPSPLLELGSSAAVRTSVLAGVGPAVLSTLATAPWIASGALHEVQVQDLDLRRTLRAVWRSPRTLGGPAGDLVNLARRSRLPQYSPEH
ncbi:LysR family transcriptional regulator [Tomitella fengzijianii]|uniref:LysR family transcriptional regulator n=1 Tax=Tomitella fengzijianii TaxID=2597660 RepID=A0A516X699_9ACTN|nr:LysR family transcriptional regulator [Tomitella fengzijianii]QDQ98533.1 LysR family transcriptional regulator [Tomitella fengzijianii]